MVGYKYITGAKCKVYRDGQYLGNLTALTLNHNQPTNDREFLGSTDRVTRLGIKELGGTMNSELRDEANLAYILGLEITSRDTVTSSNITKLPTTDRGDVTPTVQKSQSFTTPNKTGLLVNSVAVYLKAQSAWAGQGVDVSIQTNSGGNPIGTPLEKRVKISGADITEAGNWHTVYWSPEADEPAPTANTLHHVVLERSGKILTGTVTVVNASATIEGAGTAFTTELAVGDKVKINSDNTTYEVSSITDNDTLVLTTTWAGSNGSGLQMRKLEAWSGIIDVMGITEDTDISYSVLFDTSSTVIPNYEIRVKFQEDDGTDIFEVKYDEVVWMRDGVTINPKQPIEEATDWVAKKATVT